MKKELIEEIKRIQEITYKEQFTLNEGFLDKLLNKTKDVLGLQKKDVSSKADYVDSNVQDFFNTLEKASETGLQPQQTGGMTYQKEVEALQIALLLLGYDLPRFGVDGLYGPETTTAVSNFNKTITESVDNLRSTLSSLGYNEKGSELTSGGQVSDQITNIVEKVLNDFKQVDPKTKIVVTAGNDMFHKRRGGKSGHIKGNAIDITLKPYSSSAGNNLKKILDKYKSSDSKFNYIDEYANPSRGATGGHFHLEYGGSFVGGQVGGQIEGGIATSETISKIIEQLKHKNITSEDIKQYVDPVLTGGGGNFTDLDLSTNEGFSKYAQICTTFISKYPNPLNINGEMMASSAQKAFNRYGNYVPPELALSQLILEGGINNKDMNSRPIRTKNPFNVGNVDNGDNVYRGNVQDGIDAYYNLIAKNYLGKGKTASDLINNFVNLKGDRYASATDYENKLASITQKVNNLSQSLMA